MLRADAAIVRAAVDDLGLELERPVAGLVVALDLAVALRVAVGQRLELTMLGAALAQEHAVVARVQLGIQDLLAVGADRASELQEDLVACGASHISHHTTAGSHGAPSLERRGETTSRRQLAQ